MFMITTEFQAVPIRGKRLKVAGSKLLLNFLAVPYELILQAPIGLSVTLPYSTSELFDEDRGAPPPDQEEAPLRRSRSTRATQPTLVSIWQVGLLSLLCTLCPCIGVGDGRAAWSLVPSYGDGASDHAALGASASTSAAFNSAADVDGPKLGPSTLAAKAYAFGSAYAQAPQPSAYDYPYNRSVSPSTAAVTASHSGMYSHMPMDVAMSAYAQEPDTGAQPAHEWHWPPAPFRQPHRHRHQQHGHGHPPPQQTFTRGLCAGNRAGARQSPRGDPRPILFPGSARGRGHGAGRRCAAAARSQVGVAPAPGVGWAGGAGREQHQTHVKGGGRAGGGRGAEDGAEYDAGADAVGMRGVRCGVEQAGEGAASTAFGLARKAPESGFPGRRVIRQPIYYHPLPVEKGPRTPTDTTTTKVPENAHLKAGLDLPYIHTRRRINAHRSGGEESGFAQPACLDTDYNLFTTVWLLFDIIL
ncbi:hypothetical protein JB92DRAFT_3210510 [Gautieria morchelliformis]|nr:hypothetical protein JB92DRAFT_3210510 [Gautieria morchelliformis]